MAATIAGGGGWFGSRSALSHFRYSKYFWRYQFSAV